MYLFIKLFTKKIPQNRTYLNGLVYIVFLNKDMRIFNGMHNAFCEF